MLADVQIHRTMVAMTKLTLRQLEEDGAGAITEERLTEDVYQLVKLQEFNDPNADAQTIYALAAIIVSEDLEQIETIERTLIKHPA